MKEMDKLFRMSYDKVIPITALTGISKSPLRLPLGMKLNYRPEFNSTSLIKRQPSKDLDQGLAVKFH